MCASAGTEHGVSEETATADSTRAGYVLREQDAILSALGQPVYVGTPDGVITYANPAAVIVLGFDDASDLIGQNGHFGCQADEVLGRELAEAFVPPPLLAAAVERLATRLPIPVELDVPGLRLPELVESSIYFFCSEALTNVVKHARASSAYLRVALEDDRSAVEVRDDGIGGADSRPGTSGLTGLRDRIGALKGVMEVSSPVAGGTVLRAWIPLPSEPATFPPQPGV